MKQRKRLRLQKLAERLAAKYRDKRYQKQIASATRTQLVRIPHTAARYRPVNEWRAVTVPVHLRKNRSERTRCGMRGARSVRDVRKLRLETHACGPCACLTHREVFP